GIRIEVDHDSRSDTVCEWDRLDRRTPGDEVRRCIDMRAELAEQGDVPHLDAAVVEGRESGEPCRGLPGEGIHAVRDGHGQIHDLRRRVGHGTIIEDWHYQSNR